MFVILDLVRLVEATVETQSTTRCVYIANEPVINGTTIETTSVDHLVIENHRPAEKRKVPKITVINNRGSNHTIVGNVVITNGFISKITNSTVEGSFDFMLTNKKSDVFKSETIQNNSKITETWVNLKEVKSSNAPNSVMILKNLTKTTHTFNITSDRKASHTRIISSLKQTPQSNTTTVSKWLYEKDKTLGTIFSDHSVNQTRQRNSTSNSIMNRRKIRKKSHQTLFTKLVYATSLTNENETQTNQTDTTINRTPSTYERTHTKTFAHNTPSLTYTRVNTSSKIVVPHNESSIRVIKTYTTIDRYNNGFPTERRSVFIYFKPTRRMNTPGNQNISASKASSSFPRRIVHSSSTLPTCTRHSSSTLPTSTRHSSSS